MTRFVASLILIGLGLFFSAPDMVESILGRELVDETTVPQPLKVLGGLMVLAGALRLMDINLTGESSDEKENDREASPVEGKSQS